MAHTPLGELADLLQNIEDHGLPGEAPLKAKLYKIYELVQEDANLAREQKRMAKSNPGPTRDYGPYEKLSDVLMAAFKQAAEGKGKDRHVKADGQRFEHQPICSLQRLYGRGYAFGQVGKKMEESERLPYEQARAELLGGIVYLAAAVVTLDEDHGQEKT